jgi:hypothetical protein
MEDTTVMQTARQKDIKERTEAIGRKVHIKEDR